MGIRISEMEEATTFGADDYVPIVTSGTNKKALGQKIKDFIAGFFVAKDDNSRLITSLGQTFTDCDAVMTAGMYYNNMGNVSNAPAGTMVSANGGQLIVTQRASDVRIIQTLYVYVGNGNKTEIYVRSQKNATSFAEWTQLAKTDGSNISDAAAFRSAIGVAYTTETYSGTTNASGTILTDIAFENGIISCTVTAQNSATTHYFSSIRRSQLNKIYVKVFTDGYSALANADVIIDIVKLKI